MNTSNFLTRLESKIREQLSAKRVGYLMGAGSSFLDGAGYPLSFNLWDQIKVFMTDKKIVSEIQELLDNSSYGLEATLDQLDQGGAAETPHRHAVKQAIAKLFITLSPPLEVHIEFIKNISCRLSHPIKVFSLNYDPLIEWAADRSSIRLIDGFSGFDNAFFKPTLFEERIGRIRGSFRGRRFEETARPLIHLVKLHGSIAWVENSITGIRRLPFNSSISESDKLLMIPPQRRKATETMVPPYSALWSEFRGCLSHYQTLLNRLFVFGYGFADEHVNAVIENALARPNFTLLAFSYSLPDHIWERYSQLSNVVLVTSDRASLKGESGAGHPTLWDFKNIIREV